MAVSVAGLWRPVEHAPTPSKHATDASVYRAIVERVRKGEPYEQAAVTEQRLTAFPVRPFLAVRPPALATVLALVPMNIAVGAELLLVVIVIGAWALRLRTGGFDGRQTAWSTFLVFTGVVMAATGEPATVYHETWAGLLIALSLALRTDRHFWAAVVFGLLAALVRELAMPYLLVMAFFAAMERRRTEALAFSLALALALTALAWHARQVMALTNPGDMASPGWMALGGWPFVLATAKWSAIVAVAGAWSAAVIVPLSIFGAGGWKDGGGLRLLALLVGYSLGFMVLGRPENRYWGLMTAPLVGVGLALAPWALIDLGRRALARSG